MSKVLGSMLVCFISLAIFIVVSLLAVQVMSWLGDSPESITRYKPTIYFFALLISSLPWIFLAKMAREDGWSDATKYLYFLPFLLVTVSFAAQAVMYAVVFVFSRFYFGRTAG